MRQSYSVTVLKNGEPLVTIERTILSGLDPLSPEDLAAIRDCGEHLLAFAGPEHHTCFACGHVGACKPDCPISMTDLSTTER